MTIYKKLSEARVKLQSIDIKKSGYNKFVGYSYFELGDFLPHINEIFNEIGLCGIISFNSDIAELWIHDTETAEKILFTSPMSEANLKGCHPIQNLGAVQSYLRRYLWMNALEIVEHDALDATTDPEKPIERQEKQNDDKPWYSDKDFESQRALMLAKIESGDRTATQILSNLRTTYKVNKKIAELITALGN